MDDHELIVLLKDPESDRVERKESVSDPNRIREAVCAFANDLPDHGRPGLVFVGVRDDGSCSGIEISEELLLKLSQMRDDGNIIPLPSITVEKRVLEGCHLAVITVQPSSLPPVRFRGRTWIRVGPRRAIASVEEEQRLTERRRSRDLPFDARPVAAAGIGELDLEFFTRTYVPSAVAPEIVEANQRTIENQLQGLRFLGDAAAPTAAGLLVVGKDPRQWLPGAYVQFVRFGGRELADPIVDQKEVSGRLNELLRHLDEILEANISVRTSVTEAHLEVQRPTYPIAALQQLTRNAVLHRTYEGTNAPVLIYWFEDRIEVHSPGGPFGRVTPETFGKPGYSDYRNPTLAEAMKNLGYVQRFGVGIEIARRELERNGNPPLEFEVQPNHVLAIVRSA
ncbi:MAG: putative DNA binding domain-containing protein [Acidobacteria bacterium]|nr:putative DNA binding domain-containing protein [Acidobacteriota bacterium]